MQREHLIIAALAAAASGCGLATGVNFGDVRPRDETTAHGGGGAAGEGGGVQGGGGLGGAGGEGGNGGEEPGCDPERARLDAEGCLCAVEGAIRDCWLGEPTPPSACAAGGTQTCDDMDGTPRWSACMGATSPSAESCFNDVDDDCDGVLDDGCPCSGTVDMCSGLSAGDHLMLPAQAAMGSLLEIYLVSTLPVPSPALLIDNGYCAGGAGGGSCNPGSGCAGWYAYRQALTVTNPPFSPNTTATITLFINDAGAPCDGGHDRTVTGMVPIVP